jgi:hypothetical protein
MVGRSHWGIRGAIIFLWFDNALREMEVRSSNSVLFGCLS